METATATIKITGISSLSQSRQHNDPKAHDRESPDDYDARTWRSKLNVSRQTGTVIIPQHGMQQALIAAARYSKMQIPGQGKATYTKKFEGGIAILNEIDTGILPEDVDMITISANSDGVRGSGKRVPRRFPMLHEWSATFDVTILDLTITEPVMRTMVEIAGMFIGIGRFRPEKGGQNGRFRLDAMDWQVGHNLMAAE